MDLVARAYVIEILSEDRRTVPTLCGASSARQTYSRGQRTPTLVLEYGASLVGPQRCMPPPQK